MSRLPSPEASNLELERRADEARLQTAQAEQAREENVRAAAAATVGALDLAWTNKRIFRVLAIGTAIVGTIWNLPAELLYFSGHAHEIFLTLVLAMTGTYLLRPAVNWFERSLFRRSRQGRMWATLMAFAVAAFAIWVFVQIGLKPIGQDVRALVGKFMATDADARAAQIQQWKDSLAQALAPFQSFLPFDVQEIDESAPIWIGRGAHMMWDRFSHSVSPGFIVELILVPVLVFYFLTDAKPIRNEAKLLVPMRFRARGALMMAHLDRVLDGYIRGQVIMCLIAWVLVTLGLVLLRVPYAFTLGLLAGLTRAVPVIGPLLGGVPIVLTCLLTTKSVQTTVILLIGFTLMHFLESKVLLPKIVGHEVDLHPVSVIVSLLIGMEFFGVLGVFLAVPLAAVLKIVLAEYHATQEAKHRLENGATEEASSEVAIIHAT